MDYMHLIGWGMIVMLFVSLYVVEGMMHGFKIASIAYAITIFLITFIFTAFYLISLTP